MVHETSPADVEVTAALPADNENDSPEANEVCEKLDIRGFVKKTPKDFKHTLELLKKAGVDKSFDFAF